MLLFLTRRVEVSVMLFSVLFFPGILLHELSHFFSARLVGVRTGRLSLIPRPMADGHLRLGSLETAPTDVLRDALIGVAPLLVGGAFVAYVGIVHLQLPDLWSSLVDGQPGAGVAAFRQLVAIPDFWLWFYLILAVSSTMMPSRSDRRAWLPVALATVLLILLSVLAGAGPWMLAHFAPPLDQVFRVVAMVFAISLGVHLLLWPIFYALRKVLPPLARYGIE